MSEVITASPTAAHVDRILKESRLDPAVITHSQRSYQRHLELKALAAGGWHGPDNIVTLKGLAGNYLWAADPLLPSQMSLRFDVGHEGSQGTYTLTSGIGIKEGVFYCVPNNPAIGWAFISLVPNNGGEPSTFTVAGMMTDAAWKIWILLLNRVGASGPIEPPFSVLRTL